MNREMLIQQVKDEYSRLADMESRDNFVNQSYSGITPQAYYESLLDKVIHDISADKYDDCVSGREIVETVANHKYKSERIRDSIESTIHNVEIAEELIAETFNNKIAKDLQAKNERRVGAIPSMIREMKEEEAREDQESNSPDVIGGGVNG